VNLSSILVCIISLNLIKIMSYSSVS
jgi:hypothetical protein